MISRERRNHPAIYPDLYRVMSFRHNQLEIPLAEGIGQGECSSQRQFFRRIHERARHPNGYGRVIGIHDAFPLPGQIHHQLGLVRT